MSSLIDTTLTQQSQFVNPKSQQSQMTTEILNKHQSTEYPITDLERWARDEWEKSGAGELFDANVKTYEGLAAINKTLISDKLPKNNTGRISAGYLAKYDHLYDGGWFMPVLNPLADFAVDDWGCFKPVKPRIEQDGIKLKTIKYEHPPLMPVQPFILRVTYKTWERIAQDNWLVMPELPEFVSDQGFDHSKPIYYGKEFWEWVIANNLPIIITEGVKKAASLLCAGYVAIGLPGIWNFSDTSDKDVAAWKRPLNPWLQSFFSRFEKLSVTIAFDADTRERTAKEVYKAACRLANKIGDQVKKQKKNRQTVSVKIAQWHPELGKGIDDVLVQSGIETVSAILDSALPFQVSEFRKSLSLSYPVIDVEQRYLFNGRMPKLSAKMVAIKSPKNTGKTYCLEGVVREATQSGKKVIVLGHRVQLMSHLCDRFGIQFLNEITSKEDWLEASYMGLGLCINSLHPSKKAKIDLTVDNDFDNCILIIDECEQVLSTLLDASTLKSERAEILTQLTILCEDAEKIYLADADLSDLSVNFFKKMADLGKSDVAVIQNNYKFDESTGWDVYLYQENNPDRLLKECQNLLQQGKRLFLLCGGQKATTTYSAQNIATRLSPYTQGKVLVVDAVTVADPDHESYGIATNLGKLGEYQLVLTTGVLETGVSIEKDFFDHVVYIGYGVHTVQSAAQFLARYRRPVDRHIWIPKFGNRTFMKFKGALSSKQIEYRLDNSKKRIQGFLKDFPILANGLRSSYCESVARNNLGLSCYQENLEWLLASDGHRCQYVDPVKVHDPEIREIRKAADEADTNNTDTAEKTSADELDTYNNSTSLTKAQRYKQRKGNLIRQYGDCYKALIKADKDGCFRPLQLLYFLTVGKDFAASYDAKQVKTFTSKTQCLDHEITKYAVSLRLAYLGVLFDMGLSRLLTGEKFSKDDPFLTDVIDNLNPDEFVQTFGRDLPKRTGDRINAILDVIGYRKRYAGRVGTGANAIRRYKAVKKFKDVDVDQIFAYWLDRDMKSLENSLAGDFAGDDSLAGDFAGDDSAWKEQKQLIGAYYADLQSQAKENGWADTWVEYRGQKEFGSDFYRFLEDRLSPVGNFALA